LSSALHKLTAK